MIKDIVVKAYNFAEQAHKSEKRKFSDLPYFSHVKYVARTLEDLHCHPDLVAAGFLHDILENTSISSQELKDEFGEKIFSIIYSLSNNEEEIKKFGGKRLYLAAKLIQLDDDSLTVKLADRYHNVLFLEHDATPEEFIKKYYKETKYIISSLLDSGRNFNEVQMALIKRIEAILEFLRIRYFLKWVN